MLYYLMMMQLMISAALYLLRNLEGSSQPSTKRRNQTKRKVMLDIDKLLVIKMLEVQSHKHYQTSVSQWIVNPIPDHKLQFRF
jgi:hypothetical protein